MNKIYTAIFTVITAILVLCMGAHAQTENLRITEAELLKSLDVIDNIADETKQISRIEFLELCLGLTNEDEIAAGYTRKQVFKDVGVSHAKASVIAFGYNAGYVIGYSGNFYPDRIITLSEANSILIRTTGYSFMAQAKGETYAIGAMNMNKNINLGSNDKLTYSDAYRMIYNILEAPYYEKLSAGDTITLADDIDRTVMGYFLNTYKERGILTAAGTVSLTDSKYDADYAIISDTEYKCTLDYVEDYVGYKVEFYYRSDGKDDDALLAAYPYMNDLLSIDAANLVTGDASYGIGKIVYHTEKGKEKKAEIEPCADMIYNGEAYPDFDKTTLSPKEGKITLVDNDTDGIYDVIIMEEYKNIVVKNANTSDRIIIGMDNSKLDLDISSGQEVIILGSDGSYYEFGDIMAGDVLTVYQSKSKKSAVVYVTSGVIFDEITSIVDKDERIVVSAGGKEYEIDRNFSSSEEYTKNPVTLKTNTGLYTDMFGRVVGIGDSSGKFKNYGYIYAVAEPDGADNEYQIKMFTQKGIFEIFTLKKNVLVDGKSYSAADTYKEITKRGIYGIIQYETSISNIISSIKYPVDNTATGKCMPDTFSLDAVTTGGQEGEYRGSGIFGAQYRISESTVVFGVPDMSKPSNRDEKKFKLMNKRSFSENTNYVIEAYDFDEVYCAGAIITRPLSGNISYEVVEPEVFVVDSVVKAINEEKEIYDIVSGWWQGRYVEYPVSDDETYAESILKDCKHGDILRVYLTDGEMTSMRRLIRLADSPAFCDTAYDGAYFGARGYMIYGKVGAVKDSAFVVSPDGGNTWKPNAISSANVYLYEKEKGKVSKGNISDIYAETELGKYDGDTVFVNIKWNSVKDIIIVR